MASSLELAEAAVPATRRRKARPRKLLPACEEIEAALRRLGEVDVACHNRGGLAAGTGNASQPAQMAHPTSRYAVATKCTFARSAPETWRQSRLAMRPGTTGAPDAGRRSLGHHLDYAPCAYACSASPVQLSARKVRAEQLRFRVRGTGLLEEDHRVLLQQPRRLGGAPPEAHRWPANDAAREQPLRVRTRQRERAKRFSASAARRSNARRSRSRPRARGGGGGRRESHPSALVGRGGSPRAKSAPKRCRRALCRLVSQRRTALAHPPQMQRVAHLRLRLPLWQRRQPGPNTTRPPRPGEHRIPHPPPRAPTCPTAP